MKKLFPDDKSDIADITLFQQRDGRHRDQEERPLAGSDKKCLDLI